MIALFAGLFAHPLMLFALGNLKRDLAVIWGWLCHRSFWQLMFGAALLLAGWEYIGKRAEQRHAHKVEAQLSKSETARKADRDAYAKAQADAAVQNKAQVAAIVTKQENINHVQVSTLNARLELIRSELRKPAAQGAPGVASASPGVESPCRVIDPAWLCLSPEERLRAAENEERHDELIDLVTAQSQVDPNK